MVITFAPSGSAGLIPREDRRPDPLLARSHAAVLSFPDPESLVAGLPGLAESVERDPGMDALRFWARVGRESGADGDLGRCVLGPGGDAAERLWVLLDNAKRHRYRILAEPMLDGLPSGDPLICPCRALIESDLLPGLRVERVVPAGDRLVAVGSGEQTAAAT
jgi:hypothetical protein